MDETRTPRPDGDPIGPAHPLPTPSDKIYQAIERRKAHRRLAEQMKVLEADLDADRPELDAIFRANGEPAGILFLDDMLVRFGGTGFRVIEGRSAYDLEAPPADVADPVTLTPEQRSILDRPEVRAQCGGPLRSFGQ
jgi:hypothetical protein